MDVIVQRPAALDVHKEQVTACVRVPAPDGSRTQEVRELPALREALEGSLRVAARAAGLPGACGDTRGLGSRRTYGCG